MEKIYEANNELAELIISKGWKEIHSPNENWYKKGNRLFKKSNNSYGEIYFDCINIQFNTKDDSFLNATNISEKHITYFLNYCENNYLRKILEKEIFSKTINGFENVIKKLETRISLYQRFASEKHKIESWKKTVYDLTFKN